MNRLRENQIFQKDLLLTNPSIALPMYKCRKGSKNQHLIKIIKNLKIQQELLWFRIQFKRSSFSKNTNILINWRGWSMKIKKRRFIVAIQDSQKQQYSKKSKLETKLLSSKKRIKIRINGLMNCLSSNMGKKQMEGIITFRDNNEMIIRVYYW